VAPTFTSRYAPCYVANGILRSSQAEEQRTRRHKENKRRYRARRREYVAELEQKLVEGRHQDVAAMKEMQLAAQKVVNENTRLRALLQSIGVQNKAVESWIRGDETCAKALTVRDALPIPLPISRVSPLNSVSSKDPDFGQIIC
jgi:hypothetical protein